MGTEYVLSLKANETTAMLSGTCSDGTKLAGREIILSHAPFVSGDLFYYPLEDVTLTLGGSYEYRSGTATVTLGGLALIYTAGSRTFAVNGDEISQLEPCPSFSDESVSVP